MKIRLWSYLESYRRIHEVKNRFKMSSTNNNKWFTRLLLFAMCSYFTVYYEKINKYSIMGKIIQECYFMKRMISFLQSKVSLRILIQLIFGFRTGSIDPEILESRSWDWDQVPNTVQRHGIRFYLVHPTLIYCIGQKICKIFRNKKKQH